MMCFTRYSLSPLYGIFPSAQERGAVGQYFGVFGKLGAADRSIAPQLSGGASLVDTARWGNLLLDRWLCRGKNSIYRPCFLWYIGGMKRLLAAILLLYLTTPLFSSGMEIVHSVSYPMQLRLEWTAVGGSDYYDVYLDRVPMARVRDGHQAVIGSNDEPLRATMSTMCSSLPARRGHRADYAAGSARTGGWEGRYQW